MEIINRLRDGIGHIGVRLFGIHKDQPRHSVSQKKIIGKESDVHALPVDDTLWQPLQDLDPTSATFGLFYFMGGFDNPGDPLHPMR